MSINLPNYGRSSSRQSTYHHHSAPQPPPQPFRVEEQQQQQRRRRRSEDAQPNLDEGKNLRPAHYVIGRKEPEPAPPQVLASSSIRPSASSLSAGAVASGRFQASSNGAVSAHTRPATSATSARANPSQARPGPVSNQVPTGPRSSSSIASGSGQAWPERGQRSSYTPSSATNQGYTGKSTGAPARTPTTATSGRAHLPDEDQAYRLSSAAAATSKVSQSNATASSSTARPGVRPSVPMPFRSNATSTSVPSPVLPDPTARNPLFRPPANIPTMNASKAVPAAALTSSRPLHPSSSAPIASSSYTAGPSLFRPRSPSPIDVKPNVQSLRREEPVASFNRSAPAASATRPSSSSAGLANITSTLRNPVPDRPPSRSDGSASTSSREANTRMDSARPTTNDRVHQTAPHVSEATLPTARLAAAVQAELPQPQRYLEVFPLPLECRHTGDRMSDQVRDKRSLFIQSLYEDLEIQHSKPIIPLNSSFLDEEVELEYRFEELHENEICVKLPVGIRRSSAHFAGSVAPARESFKLGQVAWFAHHQEKMAKETHFTFAHLVLRFGEPARTASRSSSTAPLRSSLPPSANHANRVQAVQQDNFAAPRSSPGGNASMPRVKQEPGSPANDASAPINRDSPNVQRSAALARPPTPPRPQHPGFPLNARGSYTDVQLTQKNVDAFLQIFLDRFENKRSGGRLIDFYSQEAIFSYTDVTSVAAINGKDSRTTIRAFGQYQITNTMKKIPVCTFARDAAGKLFYDATRVGVSTNPLAFLPILVNLHGQFKELESGLERSFDRTIYLHPVSGGNSYGGAAGLQYTIQSDQIFVRPLVNHQDWFVGRLPARKTPPPPAQKKPIQEARRPFVREQSIMLPMPELESAAVQRAIVDASRQERDRDLGLTSGQASDAAHREQPVATATQRPAVPTQPLNRPTSASAAPANLPNGAGSAPRPRPVPSASLRPAPADAESSQPSTPAGVPATKPAASTRAASTFSNQRASTSAPKLPSKRTIIEIDDSEDEELPEVERLVSQSSTIRAGPADARRVKQKMQESLTASGGSSTKRPVASPSPEPEGPIATQPTVQVLKKAKKAKAAAQPTAVPSELNRKLTKSEKKARRKAREEQEAAQNQPAALQRTRPGPNAFTFGSQSTISHPMHGTGNKARKMFELEQLGGYLGVNFRGNVYYWKGDTSSVGPTCLDREADDKLQVDDCIWSEKHQTIVLGYACPNAGETRPTTQLAIVRADEAQVDRHGEMTGLKREILDATPHDKVGITSLALLDQGGERNLSFVSAGNDRKISLWTVPQDGNQNVRCRAIPASHTSKITSMVWKRHGQHLATVGMDKRLCLMDLGAGRAKTITQTKELLPMGHILLHNEHQALLVLLAAKDQFKYVDLRTPSTSKALTFGRQLNSTLGAFTHGEWRDNLFAYAFEDVVALWDIRNTSKPREEKWGSSGVIQPHFESDHSLALLEKKHFTKVTYGYAAQ